MQYERHRGTFHPRRYELEVQSRLRGLRLPRPSDEAVLLGIENSEVAVASYIAFDRQEGDLRVLAIATALSHRGVGLGSAALDMSMATFHDTRRAYDLDCGAFAYIHPDNVSSRALFASRGWEMLGVYDDYEGWGHDLESIAIE